MHGDSQQFTCGRLLCCSLTMQSLMLSVGSRCAADVCMLDLGHAFWLSTGSMLATCCSGVGGGAQIRSALAPYTHTPLILILVLLLITA